MRYVPGSEVTINPRLETFDPANPDAPGIEINNQFQFSVQGIGGTGTVAGFFLDDMMLHTLEGSVLDDGPQQHSLSRRPGCHLGRHGREPADPLTP